MRSVNSDKLRSELESALREQDEALMRVVRRNDRAGKLICYGKVCMLIDVMTRLRFIDAGKAERMKHENWSICTQGAVDDDGDED